MILEPPLWATGAWVDDSWADGTWATEITLPTDFGDLTTLFVGYVEELRDDNPLRTDSPTLVIKDRPNVYAATANDDDLNTALADYLS